MSFRQQRELISKNKESNANWHCSELQINHNSILKIDTKAINGNKTETGGQRGLG